MEYEQSKFIHKFVKKLKHDQPTVSNNQRVFPRISTVRVCFCFIFLSVICQSSIYH
uniref:Uncharacterized protein n=1 Tax=Rhizophora mucronata TaxID=61149 RepID=A0A2P2Q0K6_RHIMU